MKMKVDATKKGLNFLIAMADNLVLAAIALGTLTLAMQLTYDLYFDFVNQHDHDLPYMVSELMFVLIVMELFRQVVRQIRKVPFSLKPYLTIGIIASVRGLLIMEMKTGLGDVDWTIGAVVIITFSVTILLLIIAYHFCHKIEMGQSS